MSQAEEMGVCPICGSRFAIDFLNAHVNDHLDNDQFKEAEAAIIREDRIPDGAAGDDGAAGAAGRIGVDFGSIDEDGGFEVICPYPSCGRLIRMKQFPEHTLSEHSHEANHNYACPICDLLGIEFSGREYQLLDHVKKSHKNFDVCQEHLVDVHTNGHFLYPDGYEDSAEDNPRNENNNNRNGNNSEDDDDDDGVIPFEFRAPQFGDHANDYVQEFPPEPQVYVPDPTEKTWEEKEREIIENTIHTFVEKDKENPDTCTICLDDLKKGNKIVILGCLCKFHEGCFDSYMASNPPNACPLHHKY